MEQTGQPGLGVSAFLRPIAAPVLACANQGANRALGPIVGRIQAGAMEEGEQVGPLVVQMLGQATSRTSRRYRNSSGSSWNGRRAVSTSCHTLPNPTYGGLADEPA